MADSLRQRIVDAVISRMQTISVVNGYQTDLGATVEDWPRRFDEAELEALAAHAAIGVYDLTADSKKEHVESGDTMHRLPFQIRIFAARSVTPRNLRRMIADVILAIGVDQTWGALAITTWPGRNGFVVPSESFEISGTAIEFEIQFLTETFNPY